MLTIPQLSAGIASAGLVAAIAWLVLADFPTADPGRPTTKANPVVILEAAVPAIGSFKTFDVNDENPFVPFALRKVETVTISQPPRQPGEKPPKLPPVAVPVVIVLPKLGAPVANGPKATGVILSHQGPQALLTFPGDSSATVMKPGDSAKGWTLVTVVGGNIARVKDDATGTVHDLVVADSPNAARAKPKPKTGDSNSAGSTGIQQPIPHKPDPVQPDAKPPDATTPPGAQPPGEPPGQTPPPEVKPPEKLM